jgi:hypothetical protein
MKEDDGQREQVKNERMMLPWVESYPQHLVDELAPILARLTRLHYATGTSFPPSRVTIRSIIRAKFIL